MWWEVRERELGVCSALNRELTLMSRNLTTNGLFFSLLGEKDSMIFDCTERYDPVTKQWAAVASLTFPRCGVGVCPCHGALYALGKGHIRTRTHHLVV